MHEKKKQRLIEQIQVIAADLRKQPTEDTSFVEGDYRVIDGLYVIYGDLLEKHGQLVQTIIASCGNTCSAKYVENALDEIILAQIKQKNPKKAADSIEKILLDCSVTNTVYVPLAGIKVINSVKIASVQLIDSKKALRKVIPSLKQRVEGKEGKEEFLKNVIPLIEEKFNTGCCAVVEVVAEKGKAREIATEECTFIVDLLRFGSFSVYQRGFRVPHGIAVQSQYIRPSITWVTLSSDGSFNTSYSLSGQIRPFDVSKENIQVLKRLGVIKLAKKRAEGALAKLDKQVIRSIHWFADSQAQDSEENELLNLVVCLEMFLTPGKNESISGSIAEGVAMLLYKTVKQRLKIRKFIKDAYDARSSVTHGGILHGEVNMPQLRYIVFNLILLMMQNPHKWTSVEEVQEFVKKMKLT